MPCGPSGPMGEVNTMKIEDTQSRADRRYQETQSKSDKSKQAMQSKAGKKQKNLYLSFHARQLLAVLAQRMGISETAVIELLIRDKAQRENIVLPEAETQS